MPFTELEKSEEEADLRKVISFGHVKNEIPVPYPHRDVKSAIECR